MPRLQILLVTVLLAITLTACSGQDPVDVSPLGQTGTPDQREDAVALLSQWFAAGKAQEAPDDAARSLSWILRWWWKADPEATRPEALTSHRPTVVFFVGQNESFLWTVTDSGVEWARRPGREALGAAVDGVLADLGSPAGDYDREAALALCDLLVGPALATWAGGVELQLLADDVVWPAPLAALPDPRFDDGRPLLWHGPVLWLQDWAAFQVPGHHPRTVSRLLAAGDHGPHADLALGLAAQWPGDGVTAGIGDEARWINVSANELRAFDAIHLATPAQCDGTGLVLGSRDIVPLSALAATETSRPLVFLSSCGLANSQALTTALREARVRSVVMGHSTADEAAAELSTAFYGYWTDGSAVADALRMAMLDVSRQGRFKAPGCWGQYRVVVTGS